MGQWTAAFVRRVFPAWSIHVPLTFDETFVETDGYWHAYDAHRSISLTSMVITDESAPVPAKEIAREMRPEVEGEPVHELPDGLHGWAVTATAPPSSRASRLLTGMVATEGRLLLATITAEDLDWARETWLSIKSHRPDEPDWESGGTRAPPWRSESRSGGGIQ